MALPKVFISYRRSDSLSATGRLYDRLTAAYPGMFFRDVSGIGVGVDFAAEIERAVSSSVALIAVIGPTWATEAEEGRRRLEDPDDFVRLEISSALKRGIRIIPVLVGGASMPGEKQLPPDLLALRKWNAIQLVEEYYEEGLERLIEALSPQLGPPRTQEAVDQVEVQRKLKQLRGEAEAALAVEDWLAGIQALQAAVSLDPNSAELSARLRWAHDQHKASGLYAEGQHLYEQGKKDAALGRYRQASLASSSYRNVTQLVARLETELASDTRRSTVRRWTAGAVAAIVIAVAAAAALVIWVVRSEFDTDAIETGTSAGFDDSGLTNVGGSPDPPLAGSGSRATGNGAAAAPQRLTADGPGSGPRTQDQQRTEGIGFPGRGRWRMTSQEDRSISIALALDNDGSFEVSMPAGVLDLPLSGGSYSYNDSTGMLEIMGINNLGAMFRETVHVFEREDDHFHANYLGTVWELEAAD